MTLPKANSRAITVDGVRYRWLVTAVDERFTMRVLIELAEGQGQRLVLTRDNVYRTAGVPAIVPRYVAAVVRHALALGWKPEAGGEFRLDAARLGAPRVLPRSEPPPPGLTAMHSRADLDPLRACYPWPHLNPNLIANFRLSPEAADEAVGTVFAHLARNAELPPRLGLQRILAALAELDGDDPWYLPGGIEIVIEGQLVLEHGCCSAIGEWVSWRGLLASGHQPWNGHDPFSTAALVDDGVALYARDPMFPPSATLTRERYEQMVDDLDQDLRGFTGRVEAWLAQRSSARTTHALVERWIASAGLARGFFSSP
jgi:hypothetical protein